MTIQEFHSEEVIIRELKKDSILAFNIVFDQFSSRLYYFAFGYLKSKEDSEELVQEVFTKIWDKRKELNEELSFKAFIFTIAFNIIKKHFREKAQLKKYLNSKFLDDISCSTTDEVNYNSLKGHIINIVNTLPLKRKEVFIKSRFEGLNTKEISEQMRINKKTVENHLNLALKEIRKKIKHENVSLNLFLFLFF